MLFVKVVNEEDEDNGDDQRRDPLAYPDEVEDQGRVLRRLPGDSSPSSSGLEHRT